MPKWGISDIVSHTSGLNETSDHINLLRRNFLTLVSQPSSDLISEATAYVGDFQAVYQPMMNVIVIIKRVNLRLVRQPPKGLREQDTVNVLTVYRPMLPRHVVRLTQPF